MWFANFFFLFVFGQQCFYTIVELKHWFLLNHHYEKLKLIDVNGNRVLKSWSVIWAELTCMFKNKVVFVSVKSLNILWWCEIFSFSTCRCSCKAAVSLLAGNSETGWSFSCFQGSCSDQTAVWIYSESKSLSEKETLDFLSCEDSYFTLNGNDVAVSSIVNEIKLYLGFINKIWHSNMHKHIQHIKQMNKLSRGTKWNDTHVLLVFFFFFF